MFLDIRDQFYGLQLVNKDIIHDLLAYYIENKNHLSPWEPVRGNDYHTLKYWNQQLQSMMSDQNDEKGYYFVIYHKDNEEVIGVCNISNVVRGVFQACYLGYSLAKKYEGKGIMTHSLTELIHFIFEEKKLHRIMANYLPENERSADLLKRLGFEKEGYAKSYLKIAGQWRDHVLTSLINPHLF